MDKKIGRSLRRASSGLEREDTGERIGTERMTALELEGSGA